MPKLEITGEDIFKKIQTRIIDASSRRVMLSMGTETSKVITQRTLDDKDVDRHAFKSYTKRYMQAKRRLMEGRYTGKVDLALTGDMLRDLKTQQVKKGEVSVGWRPSSFSYKKALWNNKDRHFVGIKVSRDVRAISEIFTKALHKALTR